MMDHARGCYSGNVIAVTLVLLVGLAGAVMARVPLATCPACRGACGGALYADYEESIATGDNSNSSYAPLSLRCQRCSHGRVTVLARLRWSSEPLDMYQSCEHPGHVPWKTVHSLTYFQKIGFRLPQPR